MLGCPEANWPAAEKVTSPLPTNATLFPTANNSKQN